MTFPRDVILIACRICGRYTEDLIDHLWRCHPTAEQAERRALYAAQRALAKAKRCET